MRANTPITWDEAELIEVTWSPRTAPPTPSDWRARHSA